MQQPQDIFHMICPVDAHALTAGWDRTFKKNAGDLYEKIAEQFDFDAWICGRITMQGRQYLPAAQETA